MKPQEKAKEYAIEYAENKFPYDIGGDDNWNEKHALVEEVAETACLFMHEWTKQQMIDKTINWLKEEDFGGWVESETEDLIDDFKKAMSDYAETKEDFFKEIIDYFRYQALNNPEIKDSRWKWIEYLKELKQQAQ